MLDRPEEYQRMRDAEDRLWWYRCLHQLVLKALKEVPKQAEILDAGCGTGGLLTALKNTGYECCRGFDRSPHATRFCRERGLAVEEGSLQELARFVSPGSLDALISCDNLYFLSPDEQTDFVSAAASVLRPGGLLLINVPALDAFRGMHDISVGIRQRFSRDMLCRILMHPSLEIQHIRFWPFLISPLIYAARTRQRRMLKAHPETPAHSDVSVPNPLLNRALEAIVRAEFRMLPWTPFGSSLFAVARRVANPSGLT